MPLTEFQADLARLLSSNRTPDSYLAGGSAMHIQPHSKRYSNDLDYFHDSESRVATAFSEDRNALLAAGFQVNVQLQQPGFVRALVAKHPLSTKVEWAHDSAWRFMPTIRDTLAGFILHPVDLATNKLLALVGRDEPRDYLDIHDAIERILPLGALCWAAAGKDPGFTPRSLLELLRRRGKYRPEDFARLDVVGPIDLPALKTIWLGALDDADAFVGAQDPGQVGCLYYSEKRNTFIQPVPTDIVVPHFGRPGGVLPLVG